MATFVHKPGSFSLFRNLKKKEGDRLPDYQGSGMDIDGNEFECAGWVKGEGGKKFLSCTMKPRTATHPPTKTPPLDDDSAPF